MQFQREGLGFSTGSTFNNRAILVPESCEFGMHFIDAHFHLDDAAESRQMVRICCFSERKGNLLCMIQEIHRLQNF